MDEALTKAGVKPEQYAVAPLPGKSVVGIEVPNRSRETVSMKEVLLSDAFVRAQQLTPEPTLEPEWSIAPDATVTPEPEPQPEE